MGARVTQVPRLAVGIALAGAEAALSPPAPVAVTM
jgi:hypothetical protein